MSWNLEVMNQQVQQRPVTVANGVNRRRLDRDPSIRTDTNFRSDAPSWRSSQHLRHGPDNLVVGSNGYAERPNTSTSFASGNRRSSTEKDDASPLGQIRGSIERPLHDRLLFLTMCLIGQPVEVQMKNGSIYSGIFHTANADKDFGVVLKMARLTKDGSEKVGKMDNVKEAARKAPVKTLIIYEKDFVQIIAKDVSLTADSHSNGRTRENRTEILTDSVLSQGRARDMERELKPWKPDSEAPRNLGLESTFQSTWNRNWDQFETNKNLFGVESTFDEELYTTKLERGPQTREREREAWRIAREIEGQSTRNLHLAEERGIHLASELDHLDEESRFSSVVRSQKYGDAGEEDEQNNVNKHNEDTFGDSYVNGVVGSGSPSGSSASASSAGELECKAVPLTSCDPKQVLSHSESPIGKSPLSSPLVAEPASIEAFNLNIPCTHVLEDVYREFQDFKSQETSKKTKKQQEDDVIELKFLSESLKDRTMDLDPGRSKAVGSGGKPLAILEENLAEKILPSEIKPRSSTPVPVVFISAAAAAAVASSAASLYSASLITHNLDSVVSPDASPSIQSNENSNDSLTTGERSIEHHKILGEKLAPEPADAYEALPAAAIPLPATGNRSPESAPLSSTLHPIPSCSAPTILTTHPHALSVISGPTTNVKKSLLNSNAKEFKLNPNAKAFSPSLSAARPPSPVHQGPLYMAAGLHPITPVQMPAGLGLSQIVQHPVQPTQLSQYNSSMAVASAAPYMQPPGAFLPNVGGAAGPPVLPVQATIKMPPQSQQQVAVPPYAQQQAIRYLPQATPLQPTPAYAHASGQLYPQQMMYGQPGPVFYIQQFPQGIMQGQPFPLPQQGPLPPQQASQQPKYRGGGIDAVHFNLTPTYLAGQPQHFQQSHITHLHNPIQTPPTGLLPGTIPGPHPSHGVATVSGTTIQDAHSIFGGNGPRLGGKSSSGSLQLRY